MKKILVFLLAIVMVISLFSCTGTPSYNSGNNGTSNNAQMPESIRLSTNSVSLGIGDTKALTAIISPTTASDKSIAWTSSNESVATVSSDGVITGLSAGETTVQAETANGHVDFCTVTVKQKIGNIKGTLTYKYNDYVGHKPDIDSIALLIPSNYKKGTLDYDILKFGFASSIPNDLIYAEADAAGNYNLSNVPVGEYYLVFVSNEQNMLIEDGKVLGIYTLIEDYFKESTYSSGITNKYTVKKIEVKDGETLTFSHDFGTTYI